MSSLASPFPPLRSRPRSMAGGPASHSPSQSPLQAGRLWNTAKHPRGTVQTGAAWPGGRGRMAGAWRAGVPLHSGLGFPLSPVQALRGAGCWEELPRSKMRDDRSPTRVSPGRGCDGAENRTASEGGARIRQAG